MIVRSCWTAAAVLALAAGVGAQDLGLGAKAAVRDNAGMFSAEANRWALEALKVIAEGSKVPVAVVTVDALEDRPLDRVTEEAAERTLGQGVVVLLAKADRKIEVHATRDYAERLPRGRRVAVREAFVEGLKAGRNDQAMVRGLRVLAEALDVKAALPDPPATEPGQPRPSPREANRALSAEAPSGAPLVVRNQAHLTLAGARAVVAGAEAKASAMGLRVNIAVVDDGGHLLAFARMDGARPASGYTAITKATAAATFRQPTGPLPAGGAPDLLLNLSLQNAAAAGGGKVTSLLGGLPVVVDGQILGAVGVGGGSGEQDVEVGRAGLAAFLDELGRGEGRPHPRDESGGRRDSGGSDR